MKITSASSMASAIPTMAIFSHNGIGSTRGGVALSSDNGGIATGTFTSNNLGGGGGLPTGFTVGGFQGGGSSFRSGLGSFFNNQPPPPPPPQPQPEPEPEPELNRNPNQKMMI